MNVWDRIEAWARRRRGEPDEPLAAVAHDVAATDRLEAAEERSHLALERANAAIEAVHELEDWIRGRDRRRRNRGHRPERRQVPRPRSPNVARAIATANARSSSRRAAARGAT